MLHRPGLLGGGLRLDPSPRQPVTSDLVKGVRQLLAADQGMPGPQHVALGADTAWALCRAPATASHQPKTR